MPWSVGADLAGAHEQGDLPDAARLMVALAVVAAQAALAIVIRRIEAPAGAASWLAALLFELIPLRNPLPGTPLVGS